MAKYHVEHTCGHTEVHQLVGPTRDREYRIGRLEAEPCTDCRKATFHAANAAEADELRAGGATTGLPALVGSEKQVAWAETIRAEKIRQAETWVVECEARHDQIPDGDPKKPEADAVLDLIGRGLARLRAQAEARYWIDNRNYEGKSLVRDLAKEIRAAESVEVAR